MAGETFGASQWLVWNTAGDRPPLSPWLPLGYITGGDGPEIESQERTRGAAGGLANQIKTEGLIDYPGSVTAILIPEGADILPLILKNVPDKLAFGGDLGDGVLLHDPALPTTATVSFGVDQPLTLDLSWLGLYNVTDQPAAAAAITDGWHWEDFTGEVSVAGDCYGVQSVKYNFTWATQYTDDVCGRLATYKREHRDLVCAGLTDISVDVEVLLDPGASFRDDVMDDTVEVSLVAVSNAGVPVTFTLEIDALRWTGKPSRSYVARDGLVVWSGTLSYRFLSAPTITCSVV